jgi:hypothetical protein
MNPVRFLSGLVFTLALFFGSQASAQSCTSLVNSQFNWIQSSSARYVIVTGVSLNPGTNGGSPLASYFSGMLSSYASAYWAYNPATGSYTLMPARLNSTANSGTQAFNDRSYWSNYGSPQRRQNFSVWAVDGIQLELDANGVMTLILNTWANTRVSISNATCNGNVMTGYNGTALHAFTFNQSEIG